MYVQAVTIKKRNIYCNESTQTRSGSQSLHSVELREGDGGSAPSQELPSLLGSGPS